MIEGQRRKEKFSGWRESGSLGGSSPLRGRGPARKATITNYEGNLEGFLGYAIRDGILEMNLFLSDQGRFKLYPIYSTLDAQHYRSSIPKGES
jgi:hypothetical protein